MYVKRNFFCMFVVTGGRRQVCALPQSVEDLVLHRLHSFPDVRNLLLYRFGGGEPHPFPRWSSSGRGSCRPLDSRFYWRTASAYEG